MAEVVGLAVESIGEAQVLQAAGKKREAMDALVGVDGHLQEASVLYRAILSLHRHR